MSPSARQLAGVVLLLAAFVGLFIGAESGQRRLADASRRMENAAQRERALGELVQLVSQAESAQRSYLLLADVQYLAPYGEARAKIQPALTRLQLLFSSADPAVRADVGRVQRLTRQRLGQLQDALDLYRERGRSAAVALARNDVGQGVTAQIATLVGDIQAQETEDMFAASRAWRSDQWSNLALRSVTLVAGIVLLWWLSRLVLQHLHAKELEAALLAERQAELERLVAGRTAALTELSTQLQSVAEEERAALSRELHDELGGLLVAARMDVSWLEQHLHSEDPAVQSHFRRVHQALQAGVDLKRRVVEELRPTLLDNLGLVPALRWLLAETCRRAQLSCSERYPSEALDCTPEAAIAIFRIVQEALTNVLKHAHARSIALELERTEGWLHILIRDDGVGVGTHRRPRTRAHGLAAMRHRAQALGGECVAEQPPGGGTEVRVRLPLERVLRAVTPECVAAPL
ncbi:MAG: CHASE3 domain-containing protein [Gammaproteobacteria bacterium]|nr:CHASE3 domain-containing protein [Gammaproteobacteria bacterium]